MKKTKYLFSLVLVIAILSAVLAFSTASGENSVFELGSFYTVEENYTSDLVSDGKAGTLIKTTANEQSLLLKSSLSGVFEVELRPLASTTGVADFTRINFYIRSNDSRYGFKMYFNDGDLSATSSSNKPKYGVSLVMPERVYGWGKSKANNGLTKAASAGFRNDGETARFGFDPETMEVYCYNNGAKSVMVDLDSEQSLATNRFNTNVIYKGFSSYSVEMTVEGITGESAQFIIYSINGQNLSGDNSAGPVLSGNPKISNAVVNQEYTVDFSAITTYDFIDGFKNDYKGNIDLISPSGKSTPVVNGKFTATETGEHFLRFTPVDSEGVSGTSKDVKIMVLGAMPDPTIELAFPLENYTIAKDTLVYFPSVTAESKLDLYNEPISPVLTIKKNGKTVTSYDATNFSQYMFTETGEYTVEISAVDVLDTEVKKTATVTVTDSAPYIEFAGKMENIYVVDTTLNIPTAKVAGGSVTTMIEYPDGRSLSANCVVLDALGVYKVTYKATVGGTSSEYVKYFVVDRTSASLLTNYSAITSTSAVAPDYAAEAYEGVKITGSRSMSTARWANVINLKDNTADDKLLEFFVMPEEQGVKEYTTFQIKLTDIYDPTRFVILQFEEDPYADDYVMDGSVCANTDNIFASIKSLRMSPYGAFNSSRYYGWYPAIKTTIYYDYETMTISGSLPNQNNTTATKYDLVKLDNESVLGIGNGFKGFTTGEVYLDITFVTLSSSSPDMLIMNVDGQDLSTEYVVDTTAPFFCIDYDGNDEDNLPYGLVGSEYPIYSAVARDTVDGLCAAPDVKVYYYESDGSRSRYSNVTETTFIPNKEGKYGIEYVASDKHGNEAVHVVTVDIVSEIPEITYDWGDIKTENVYTGIKYTIPTGKAEGGSGKLKITTKITLNDEEIVLDGSSFIPEKSGDYVITVTIEDYLKNVKELEKVITVTANPNPVLVEATVPSGVIVTPTGDVGNEKKERGITFAEWKAFDYSMGTEGVLPVTITVKLKDAPASTAITLGNDRKWIPTTAGIYEVSFSAVNDNGIKTEVIKEVEALDLTQKGIYLSNYFTKEGVTITAPSRSSFQISAEKSGATVSFVNALPADGFNVRFSVPGGKNGFESLTITLVDSVNPEEKLVMTIVKEVAPEGTEDYKYVDESAIWVNGIEREILGSFHNISNNPFDISYDNDSHILTDYVGNTITTVSEKEDGSKWSGFTSGKVYMSMTFNGVESDSMIALSMICGQAFGSAASDRSEPSVILPVAQPAEYGEKLIIPAANAYDVLSKLTEFKVTVVAPSGKVLLDGVDATVDYELDVTEYGNYDVKYYVEDSSGNKTGSYGIQGYIVTIRDKVPPTLTITGEVPTSIKAGTEFVAPSAILADNRVGGSATLTIWWILPSGRMIKADADGKISAEYTATKGDYKLVYYGIDVDGYTATQNFTVTVE